MNYVDGQTVKLGDHIQLGEHAAGLVICDIENKVADSSIKLSDWEYLQHGILILTDLYGLMHVPCVDPDLKLLKRA